MATHASILAWRVPQTIWSTGLQRLEHDRATYTSLSQVFQVEWLSSLRGARTVSGLDMKAEIWVRKVNDHRIQSML